MESEKATFELPSDTSGIVKEIKVRKALMCQVGQVLFVIETEEGSA